MFLLSLSTIVTAHPLDELGKDPYLADAPRALDIAIALEKNGNIELRVLHATRQTNDVEIQRRLKKATRKVTAQH